MKLQFALLSSFFFITNHLLLVSRSQYRTQYTLKGSLTIHDEDQKAPYTIVDSHLGANIFKVFDRLLHEKYLLPKDLIFFRYSNDAIAGTYISDAIKKAVDEINSGKKTLEEFVILKKRNFNFKKKAGLLILRFKKYPFIVKLFIETPESFSQPLNKGLEPICFFYMGKGMSRHLTGFTRIPNREIIQKKLLQSSEWSKKVELPRKWYWQHPNNKDLIITGHNIGTVKKRTLRIPATYAIVADEIIWERQFNLSSQEDRHTAMALSNFLDQRIDPHINNFGIEKSSGKIALIDLEHFPTVLGLNPNKRYHGYCHWYTHLASKMLCDTYYQTKASREKMQRSE